MFQTSARYQIMRKQTRYKQQFVLKPNTNNRLIQHRDIVVHYGCMRDAINDDAPTTEQT